MRIKEKTQLLTLNRRETHSIWMNVHPFIVCYKGPQ
nr:MAG TPA: hypothetical protein [Caudoviricetes sp.]